MPRRPSKSTFFKELAALKASMKESMEYAITNSAFDKFTQNASAPNRLFEKFKEVKQYPAFLYNNEWYIRVIPSKPLFRSSMIHDVITRGDVFAFRLNDGALTIIPGISEVTHGTAEIDCYVPPPCE